MAYSVPWRPGPAQEAGSQEMQGGVEEVEDELDHTGRKHSVVEPSKRPGADMFIHVEPELAEMRFQFIGETGHSRPKGAASRLVRSRARREGHRTHKQNQTLMLKGVPLLPRGTESDRVNEASDSSVSQLLDSLIRRNATISLNYRPTSNRMDPFNSLPVDKRGNSHFLINQYGATFQPTNHPYSLVRPAFRKEEFLSFSISDCAILHATLGHVALTLCELAGTKSSPDMLYHVSQAITVVNERIANRAHEAITKETIFAVACLTSLELRYSSVASVKVHLNGLQALINSAGGIQALASHPLTLRFTCWVDHLCSIALNTEPRFELVNPVPDPEDLEPHSFLAQRYKARLSKLTGLQDLSQETIEIYRILRYLIAEKELVLGLQKIERDAEFESLRAYTDQIMRRVIALVQYKVPDSNQNALIYRLFGNAALAHIVIFTRNVPPRVGVPTLMSSRIRTTLEIINLRSFQIAYQEMMLWIIMIGGLASIRTSDEGWFVQLLAESCNAVGIAGTAELALSLKEFLWSEFYLGPIFQVFWNRVAVAQTMDPT